MTIDETNPHPVFKSAAAVKRISPGTRLEIIRDGRGPHAPSGRIVLRKQGDDLILRIDDPSSAHNGEETFLSFKGTRVEPTDSGFRTVLKDDGRIMTEYVFAGRVA